jgi:hypothetical protein
MYPPSLRTSETSVLFSVMYSNPPYIDGYVDVRIVGKEDRVVAA